MVSILHHRVDASKGQLPGDLQHFLDSAIESSMNAIGFADVDGRITFVNQAFLRMWRYERAADVVGRHASAFGESEQVREILAATAASGGWIGESVGINSLGQRFPIETAVTLVRDGAGVAVGLMGSVIDISERKDAERALLESETRYRTLVESARDPIFTADITGRFLYVNPSGAAMLGLTPDEMTGKSVDELFPPHVAELYKSGVRIVIETGETRTTIDPSEIDGRKRFFHTVVQPVRDAHGAIVAAQAIVRDITERKMAEDALRQSEDRLHQAVRVASIGIFDHDHVRRQQFWSPELRRINGWDDADPARPDGLSPELVGEDHVHEDDRARVRAAVERAHDPCSDGFFDVEYRLCRGDGTLRWLKVRSQTFFEGEGAARRKVRTVGAAQDITEQKEAEAERARLQEQLTQAQKMESIGRLAGGVAHDFNNMLSVISGHVELALRTAPAGDPVRDDLDQIKAAARRATDLTRQLLGFARRQTVAPQVLDLNAAVAGSLAMLRRLIGEDIDLVWTPDPHLRHVRIDPMQVDQLLANLAANARDAIAGVGRLSIDTMNIDLEAADTVLHADLRRGSYVMLRVTDNGRGMDPRTANHLFEPFYTTKPEGHGTGLGLATVYGIVKQNDGCVDVQTGIGKGTVVRVFLPSVNEAVVTGAEPSLRPPRAGTETVLLVEDESAVLRLSQMVLGRLGYNVLTASTPGEALELFERRPDDVHLLVTDVVMPEMNGPELAGRLRAMRPGLRTLFVSGYSASTLTPRGVLDPGVHFLQKPFSLDDLAARVREALDAPPLPDTPTP